MHQIRFGPGLRPGPLPRPPSRMGRGKPPPHTSPPRRLRRLDLGTFGVSVPAPVALPPTYFSFPRAWLYDGFGGVFWDLLPPNEFRYRCNPQKDSLWAKTRRMSHINCENPSTGSNWARARDKIQYQPTNQEKCHKTVIFPLSGRSPR